MTPSLTPDRCLCRRTTRRCSRTATEYCSWLNRGWCESGPPNIWEVTSVEEVADTARTVVGPDEAFGGRSNADMEADHWASLAAVLRRQGVDADSAELGLLPHEVVLGEQLSARIGHPPDGEVRP